MLFGPGASVDALHEAAYPWYVEAKESIETDGGVDGNFFVERLAFQLYFNDGGV